MPTLEIDDIDIEVLTIDINLSIKPRVNITVTRFVKMRLRAECKVVEFSLIGIFIET